MASSPSLSSLTVFVSPKADAEGDGSAARPFTSLAEVAKNFGIDSEKNRLKSVGAVQIIRIDAPGKAVECSKPKRQYYVDTHLLGSDGDGTERDPWPSFSVAVDGIIEAVGETIEEAGGKAGRLITTVTDTAETIADIGERAVSGLKIVAIVGGSLIGVAIVVPPIVRAFRE